VCVVAFTLLSWSTFDCAWVALTVAKFAVATVAVPL